MVFSLSFGCLFIYVLHSYFRFYNQNQHLELEEPESATASREVQGLPDVLGK